MDPNSSYGVERFIYHTYAKYADSLLIVNPPKVRVSAWISAFVWLPLYVYFVIGFYRGNNNRQVPGLIYGEALTHGMITYMAEGMFGYVAQGGWSDPALCTGCVEPDLFRYFYTNVPYLILPFLMIIRMWKPNPFGG